MYGIYRSWTDDIEGGNYYTANLKPELGDFARSIPYHTFYLLPGQMRRPSATMVLADTVEMAGSNLTGNCAAFGSTDFSGSDMATDSIPPSGTAMSKP